MKNVFRLSGIALAVALACIFAACVGPEGPQGPAGGAGNSAEYVTVTFNPDGGEIDGKKGLLTQGLVKGGWAQQPKDPSKEADDEWWVPGMHRSTADGKISYAFAGWYLGDSDTPWAFNHDAVTKNITLKARWTDPVLINEVPVNDLLNAISYAASHSGTYLMLLKHDTNAFLMSSGTLTLTAPQTVDGHLIIAATGPVTIRRSTTTTPDALTAAATGLLFTLNQSSGNLTIGDNITLNGLAGTTTASRPVIRVENGASFIMDKNSVITGNTNTVYADDAAFRTGFGASAVYVNGGTFTMKKGSINGNSSTAGLYLIPPAAGGAGGAAAGGAVVLNGGSFTMEDGTITNNTTSGNRVAGVNVLSGRFTMRGGNITGNNITTAYGNNNDNTGGVFVAANANARFLMEGGSITGNAPGTPNTARQDVFVDRVATASGSITLSKDADIGSLTLTANAANQTTFITIISPGLSSGGNITLHLRGLPASWPNNTVILQGTSLRPNDVARFKLGQNYDATVGSTPIPATWSINNSGRLVRPQP